MSYQSAIDREIKVARSLGFSQLWRRKLRIPAPMVVLNHVKSIHV